jgi:hypothetical protein
MKTFARPGPVHHPLMAARVLIRLRLRPLFFWLHNTHDLLKYLSLRVGGEYEVEITLLGNIVPMLGASNASVMSACCCGD